MSAQDGIREVCKCGHDKWTHHEGKYDCLGLYCGECHAYKNEREKEEKVPATDPMPPSADVPSTPAWSWPLKWP